MQILTPDMCPAWVSSWDGDGGLWGDRLQPLSCPQPPRARPAEEELCYPCAGEKHPCAPGKGMLRVQAGCVQGWGQWGGGRALLGRRDMGMSPGSSCCGQAKPSRRARKSSPGSLMGLRWVMLGSGQTPGCGAECWRGEWSSP